MESIHFLNWRSRDPFDFRDGTGLGLGRGLRRPKSRKSKGTLVFSVCNRPLHPSHRVLVPFSRQQRNPQKLGDDRAIDPMRVPTRLRKVRPDEFSLRDELEHSRVD